VPLPSPGHIIYIFLSTFALGIGLSIFLVFFIRTFPVPGLPIANFSFPLAPICIPSIPSIPAHFIAIHLVLMIVVTVMSTMAAAASAITVRMMTMAGALCPMRPPGIGCLLSSQSPLSPVPLFSLPFQLFNSERLGAKYRPIMVIRVPYYGRQETLVSAWCIAVDAVPGGSEVVGLSRPRSIRLELSVRGENSQLVGERHAT
jgi:hypothetical protein